MSNKILSLRMCAEREGVHISGAERLLAEAELDQAVVEMIQRARQHPRGQAQRLRLQLEELETTPRRLPLLPLQSHQASDWHQGRQLAAQLLESAGVKPDYAHQALQLLARGAAPDAGVMRGAVLLDLASGCRLEADLFRGVRASRFDLDPTARPAVIAGLQQRGLHSSRTAEAWALASKVVQDPEIVAELCWSDDPDYLTGYVAAAQGGYQRISPLKAAGDFCGGRVFFVRPGAEIAAVVERLQHEPVYLTLPRDWSEV